MKTKFALLIAALSLLPLSASAFNWTRCNSQNLTTPGIFGFTSSIFTSSGQYTSSTGECSALMGKNEIRLFIVNNSETLRTELARGAGENLTTLFHLANIQDPKASQKLQIAGGIEMLRAKQFDVFLESLLVLAPPEKS